MQGRTAFPMLCASAVNASNISVLRSNRVLVSDALRTALLAAPVEFFLPDGVPFTNVSQPIQLGAHVVHYHTLKNTVYSLELVQPRVGDRMLIVGVGNGLAAFLAANVIGPAGVVHVVDENADAHAFAQCNLTRVRRYLDNRFQSSSPTPTRAEAASAALPQDTHAAASHILRPGTTFEGTCSQDSESYPSVFTVDHVDGHFFLGRFFWPSLSNTVSCVYGYIFPAGSDGSVELALVETSVILSENASHIIGVPTVYSLVLRGKEIRGHWFGTMETVTVPAFASTSTIELRLFDPVADEVEAEFLPVSKAPDLASIHLFRADPFAWQPPASSSGSRGPLYNRIYCGARTTLEATRHFAQMLAPCGMIVSVVGNAFQRGFCSNSVEDIFFISNSQYTVPADFGTLAPPPSGIPPPPAPPASEPVMPTAVLSNRQPWRAPQSMPDTSAPTARPSAVHIANKVIALQERINTLKTRSSPSDAELFNKDVCSLVNALNDVFAWTDGCLAEKREGCGVDEASGTVHCRSCGCQVADRSCAAFEHGAPAWEVITTPVGRALWFRQVWNLETDSENPIHWSFLLRCFVRNLHCTQCRVVLGLEIASPPLYSHWDNPAAMVGLIALGESGVKISGAECHTDRKEARCACGTVLVAAGDLMMDTLAFAPNHFVMLAHRMVPGACTTGKETVKQDCAGTLLTCAQCQKVVGMRVTRTVSKTAHYLNRVYLAGDVEYTD
jgi:hypothetical protein